MSAEPMPPFKGRRIHAAFYDSFIRREPEGLVKLRRHVVGGAVGRVLEIGAGTGASFSHYRRTADVTAIEPDPFMLKRARKAASKSGKSITLHAAPAERLPFADDSFDVAVCVLVLCTVQYPEQALREIRRVLKPGGTLRFLEHVRGDGWTARTQTALAPAWRWFVGGCNLDRDTEETMEQANFQIEELSRVRLSALTPAIMGVARPLP